MQINAVFGFEDLTWGFPDGVNTLIYTVLKHFVGTPSNIRLGFLII